LALDTEGYDSSVFSGFVGGYVVVHRKGELEASQFLKQLGQFTKSTLLILF
jgi:hypothetical protein